MLNIAARPGFESTSTLARTTSPLRRSTSCSRTARARGTARTTRPRSRRAPSRSRSLDHVLLESGLRHVHVVSNAAACVDHSSPVTTSAPQPATSAAERHRGRPRRATGAPGRSRCPATYPSRSHGRPARRRSARARASRTRRGDLSGGVRSLELAKLLERIDAHVRVRSDAEGNRPRADPFSRKEAVSEIGLGRRARADDASARGEQIKLGTVRMGCVDDGGPLAEAARSCKQLDRAAAVLCQALLDLARLLVGVHGAGRLGRRSARSPRASRRAGANGVRSDSDAESRGPQGFCLGHVRRDRLLTRAGEPASCIGHVQEHELDARCRGGLRRSERSGRRGSGTLRRPCTRPRASRGMSARRARTSVRCPTFRFREHRLAPRPEILSCGASSQRSLERVTVGVHEPRESKRARHEPRR